VQFNKPFFLKKKNSRQYVRFEPTLRLLVAADIPVGRLGSEYCGLFSLLFSVADCCGNDS